jgi:predicted Zn-dependent protease
MNCKAILLASATALALSGCTTMGNTSGGDVVAGQAAPISSQERAEGAKNHPQILQEFGGTYNGSQAGYVTRVGQNIAVQSGLSNSTSSFTVSLLNSPVNNAFAIPGGYVYVTRELMALMNNEAELAGVLGHEIGHVAARHSQKRQSKAQTNTILGVLGTVVGGLLGNAGGIASTVGGLLQNNALKVAQIATLGYSRGQELEADRLGIQYLARAGYDPRALSTMLASLAAQDDLEARVAGRDARSIPEWASTHPDPASRVVDAQRVAASTGANAGRLGEAEFKAAVDGVLYGDDPAQGIVEGQTFQHPDLRFAFSVPQGYGMQNGTQAVSISGANGQAMFTTAGSYNGNMSDYLTRALKAIAGDTQLQVGQVNRTTVNGLPASYVTARANTQSGAVDVTIFAYEFSNTSAFHFATLTKAGGAGVFNSMFQSVRRLSASQAAAIKPRYIDVVTVRSGDTVASLANRMAYDNFRTERFLVLNRLSGNARLNAGDKVKIVVKGNR